MNRNIILLIKVLFANILIGLSSIASGIICLSTLGFIHPNFRLTLSEDVVLAKYIVDYKNTAYYRSIGDGVDDMFGLLVPILITTIGILLMVTFLSYGIIKIIEKEILINDTVSARLAIYKVDLKTKNLSKERLREIYSFPDEWYIP